MIESKKRSLKTPGYTLFPPWRIPIAIFLISSAALIYEISLSRLLSIQMWNHYSFLIISCALLGYGSAGSFRLLWTRNILPIVPVIFFSILLVPLFWSSTHLPFDPALVALEPWHGGWLLLEFFMLALPFFLSGLTLNLLLELHTEHAHIIYASDLIGAACGCMCFFFVTPILKEIEWLAVPVILSIGSSFCLVNNKKQLGIVFAVLLVLLPGWIVLVKQDVPISSYKALPLTQQHPASRLLGTQHDASIRIDWIETPMARYAPGISLEYRGNLPEQLGLTLDGDHLSGMAPWKPKSLGIYLHFLPEWGLFFEQRPPEKVLVLETLGGQLALTAVEAGSSSILVQTQFPLLAKKFEEDNQFPQIKVNAIGARAMLNGSKQTFDRIMVSIEKSAPVGSTGMDPLRTDHLMTLEGIGALFEKLAPDGWLALHRFLLPPPRGEIRLMATVIEAMRIQGLSPNHHLGVFRTLNTLMVFVSKEVWRKKDKERFKKFISSRGYAPVFYPGMPETERNTGISLPEPFYSLGFQQLLNNPSAFHASSSFDLKPITDDRPYFYYFINLSKLEEIQKNLDGKWEGLMEAGLLIPFLFFIVSLMALLLIGLPTLLLQKLKQLNKAFPMILYFFSIGLAFMSVEIAMLEKLNPFLGQPVYTFALVLGGLLTSSAVGAFLSRNCNWSQIRLLFLLLIIVLWAYFFSLAEWIKHLSDGQMDSRLIWSWILVGAVGLLMGIPFPYGLEYFNLTATFGEEKKNRVALAWGSNGCASVVGATGALWFAQLAGQSYLFLFGSVAYGISLFVIEFNRN